jgi:hypothetical protein
MPKNKQNEPNNLENKEGLTLQVKIVISKKNMRFIESIAKLCKSSIEEVVQKICQREIQYQMDSSSDEMAKILEVSKEIFFD